MMDRRRFARLIAGSLAAGRLSGKQAEGASAKTALYSSVGGDLTLYSMDVDEASLVKRNTVSLPANIQYAWPIHRGSISTSSPAAAGRVSPAMKTSRMRSASIRLQARSRRTVNRKTCRRVRSTPASI